MDALILSCGTGGGHNAAAEAVRRELISRGHRATVLDPYTLTGRSTSGAVNGTYINVAQKAPGVFGAVYQLGEAYRRLPFRSPVYHVNKAMIPLLQEYLDTHPCDVIITTHLFPAEIITAMRARGLDVPVSVYIATDYTCIPFTEETDCDRYVIPAPGLMGEFAGRGIPSERIEPLGIPVRPEFREGGGRQAARARLGLERDGRLVLLAGGSIGAGKLSEAVGALLEGLPGISLIAVCGNNRALYDSLRRTYGGRCALLGQTSQMAEYMRACDVLVSKPGGLSSTEAANLGVPLVHITPIPGCETKNMEFFSSRGMCLPVSDPATELVPAVKRLFDESQSAAMVERQRVHIPRTAAADICDLIERECIRPRVSGARGPEVTALG